MRKGFLPACATLLLLVASSGFASADAHKLMGRLFGIGMDLHTHACPSCGGSHDGPCVERVPVKDRVVGKKKVYDSKIKYEYVSIPETRYYWKNKRITKEIPCPYCKPVCKTEDCVECVGQEKWDKTRSPCSQCGELHCKHIEPQLEKHLTKRCEHEKGETTVKVKYWSCVKVPYTVYRQVKQEVCVKQPRYEKVKVPVTRYICQQCGGAGCQSGTSAGCQVCDGAGVVSCDQ